MSTRFKPVKMDCSRGAPMGRCDYWPDAPRIGGAPDPASLAKQKLRLQRLRINRDGYDAGGAYWGNDNRVWAAFSDDREWVFFVNGDCRAHAWFNLRGRYPGIVEAMPPMSAATLLRWHVKWTIDAAHKGVEKSSIGTRGRLVLMMVSDLRDMKRRRK